MYNKNLTPIKYGLNFQIHYIFQAWQLSDGLHLWFHWSVYSWFLLTPKSKKYQSIIFKKRNSLRSYLSLNAAFQITTKPCTQFINGTKCRLNISLFYKAILESRYKEQETMHWDGCITSNFPTAETDDK